MSKTKKEFEANDFRKELNAVLPGYKWTVQRPKCQYGMTATGIQSSGFNRLSTIEVCRENRDPIFKYTAKIWGYGLRGNLIAENDGHSLKKAIRGLQDYCTHKACTYSGAASYIEQARKPVQL